MVVNATTTCNNNNCKNNADATMTTLMPLQQHNINSNNNTNNSKAKKSCLTKGQETIIDTLLKNFPPKRSPDADKYSQLLKPSNARNGNGGPEKFTQLKRPTNAGSTGVKRDCERLLLPDLATSWYQRQRQYLEALDEQQQQLQAVSSDICLNYLNKRTGDAEKSPKDAATADSLLCKCPERQVEACRRERTYGMRSFDGMPIEPNALDINARDACVAQALAPRLRVMRNLREAPRRELEPGLFKRISPEFFGLLKNYEDSMNENYPLYGIPLSYWADTAPCCPCEDDANDDVDGPRLGDEEVAKMSDDDKTLTTDETRRGKSITRRSTLGEGMGRKNLCNVFKRAIKRSEEERFEKRRKLEQERRSKLLAESLKKCKSVKEKGDCAVEPLFCNPDTCPVLVGMNKNNEIERKTPITLRQAAAAQRRVQADAAAQRQAHAKAATEARNKNPSCNSGIVRFFKRQPQTNNPLLRADDCAGELKRQPMTAGINHCRELCRRCINRTTGRFLFYNLNVMNSSAYRNGGKKKSGAGTAAAADAAVDELHANCSSSTLKNTENATIECADDSCPCCKNLTAVKPQLSGNLTLARVNVAPKNSSEVYMVETPTQTTFPDDEQQSSRESAIIAQSNNYPCCLPNRCATKPEACTYLVYCRKDAAGNDECICQSIAAAAANAALTNADDTLTQKAGAMTSLAPSISKSQIGGICGTAAKPCRYVTPHMERVPAGCKRCAMTPPTEMSSAEGEIPQQQQQNGENAQKGKVTSKQQQMCNAVAAAHEAFVTKRDRYRSQPFYRVIEESAKEKKKINNSGGGSRARRYSLPPAKKTAATKRAAILTPKRSVSINSIAITTTKAEAAAAAAAAGKCKCKADDAAAKEANSLESLNYPIVPPPSLLNNTKSVCSSVPTDYIVDACTRAICNFATTMQMHKNAAVATPLTVTAATSTTSTLTATKATATTTKTKTKTTAKAKPASTTTTTAAKTRPTTTNLTTKPTTKPIKSKPKAAPATTVAATKSTSMSIVRKASVASVATTAAATTASGSVTDNKINKRQSSVSIVAQSRQHHQRQSRHDMSCYRVQQQQQPQKICRAKCAQNRRPKTLVGMFNTIATKSRIAQQMQLGNRNATTTTTANSATTGKVKNVGKCCADNRCGSRGPKSKTIFQLNNILIPKTNRRKSCLAMKTIGMRMTAQRSGITLNELSESAMQLTYLDWDTKPNKQQQQQQYKPETGQTLQALCANVFNKTYLDLDNKPRKQYQQYIPESICDNNGVCNWQKQQEKITEAQSHPLHSQPPQYNNENKYWLPKIPKLHQKVVYNQYAFQQQQQHHEQQSYITGYASTSFVRPSQQQQRLKQCYNVCEESLNSENYNKASYKQQHRPYTNQQQQQQTPLTSDVSAEISSTMFVRRDLCNKYGGCGIKTTKNLHRSHSGSCMGSKLWADDDDADAIDATYVNKGYAANVQMQLQKKPQKPLGSCLKLRRITTPTSSTSKPSVRISEPIDMQDSFIDPRDTYNTKHFTTPNLSFMSTATTVYPAESCSNTLTCVSEKESEYQAQEEWQQKQMQKQQQQQQRQQSQGERERQQQQETERERIQQQERDRQRQQQEEERERQRKQEEEEEREQERERQKKIIRMQRTPTSYATFGPTHGKNKTMKNVKRVIAAPSPASSVIVTPIKSYRNGEQQKQKQRQQQQQKQNNTLSYGNQRTYFMYNESSSRSPSRSRQRVNSVASPATPTTTTTTTATKKLIVHGFDVGSDKKGGSVWSTNKQQQQQQNQKQQLWEKWFPMKKRQTFASTTYAPLSQRRRGNLMSPRQTTHPSISVLSWKRNHQARGYRPLDNDALDDDNDDNARAVVNYVKDSGNNDNRHYDDDRINDVDEGDVDDVDFDNDDDDDDEEEDYDEEDENDNDDDEYDDDDAEHHMFAKRPRLSITNHNSNNNPNTNNNNNNNNKLMRYRLRRNQKWSMGNDMNYEYSAGDGLQDGTIARYSKEDSMPEQRALRQQQRPQPQPQTQPQPQHFYYLPYVPVEHATTAGTTKSTTRSQWTTAPSYAGNKQHNSYQQQQQKQQQPAQQQQTMPSAYYTQKQYEQENAWPAAAQTAYGQYNQQQQQHLTSTTPISTQQPNHQHYASAAPPTTTATTTRIRTIKVPTLFQTLVNQTPILTHQRHAATTPPTTTTRTNPKASTTIERMLAPVKTALSSALPMRHHMCGNMPAVRTPMSAPGIAPYDEEQQQQQHQQPVNQQRLHSMTLLHGLRKMPKQTYSAAPLNRNCCSNGGGSMAYYQQQQQQRRLQQQRQQQQQQEQPRYAPSIPYTDIPTQAYAAEQHNHHAHPQQYQHPQHCSQYHQGYTQQQRHSGKYDG